MNELKWFDAYSGQTIEQLLSLEGKYQTDSLVVAIEHAIGKKAARQGNKSLTAQERTVLAIEAFEREVNNGGYSQYFENAHEFAPTIVESLVRINCPKTAEISREAIHALNLPALDSAAINTAMISQSATRDDILHQCDEAYHETGEDIGGQLFSFIKANKSRINL
jgi:Domain of unknown function (DUF4375)